MKKLFLSLIVLMTASFMLAETVFVSSERNEPVSVLRSDGMSTVIEYSIGSFNRIPVAIEGESYYHIALSNEPVTLEEGVPELPYMSRSIIIPGDALTDVRIISTEYTDFEMKVVPSKGEIYRNQTPSEIPYTFSDVYQVNTFYPEILAELGEPFILRDFRGQVVRVNPFQYNPVEGILRVHHSISVEVNTIGTDDRNVMSRTRDGYTREFENIYQNRFLNFSRQRYTPLEEQGRMIVIAYDAFVDATMPYVDWKNQKGVPTTIYPVSTIGTNATAIKNFIQAEYDQDDGLVFVQIVGDAPQVPPMIHGGRASDPSYSLLAGNDPYGDIFVGRFSSETVAQVETQVERSVHYERDTDASDTWLANAMNVAYNGGPGHGGLYDDEHSELIRLMLLDYTYVHGDAIYAPSATAAMVTNAVNEGRSIGNYTGHGSTTSWGTTGFSNSHVNALTNDYMLPFIVSVACVNGNFASTTCFAEAWLRATNNTTGAPTGGLSMYASSRNQLWHPPMSAQIEIAELLVNEQKNTIGGLFYNGSFQMIIDYPSQNQGPNEFLYWHIFGDASLQVRTMAPEDITVNHMNETFIGLDYFEVDTDTEDLLVTMMLDGEILDSGYTGSDGNIVLNFDEPPVEPTEMTLTITGYNKTTYVTEISVIPSEGPYVVIQNVDIIGSGENGSVNYGDEAMVNIRLRNVGIETAHLVEATLTTDDPYITILDDNDFFGHIAPGSNVLKLNAFCLQVDDYVPDQHQAYFSVEIEDNDGNSWISNFNFLINAPEYDTGSFTLDDSEYGDGDGYLDPGETVELTIPVSNIGHAVSPITSVQLVSGSSDITIDSDDYIELGAIYPDDMFEPSFLITASQDIEIGSIYTFGFLVTGGDYQHQTSFALSVGPVIEDFESGDFSAHNWSFDGNQPWMIVTDEVYEGVYAARSGNITHNQSSTMSLTLDVAAAGEISFYRKVSSENNYDFLRFYINDDMVGQWSGEVNWSQVSYPVQAGNNTFTWTYIKDHIISHGSDCAWIDFIEFPTSGEVQGGPVFLANPAHIDFNVVVVDETAVKPFWVRNFGDEDMSGTIEVYDGFEVQSSDPDIIRDVDRAVSGRNTYNYVIPPQSNIQFDLLFMPVEDIDYSGELLLTSNADNMTEASLNIVAYGFILLPAENLAADLGDDHVILTWEAPEIDFDFRDFEGVHILGYNVFKDGEMINDNLVTNEFYADYDITAFDNYSYSVTVVYNIGESQHSETIEVFITSADDIDEMVPHVTELRGNYPNPFNPATTITLALKQEGHVRLEIYNILGQKVKTLIDEVKDPGVHSIVWDGSIDNGREAASGVYLYRMKTGDYDRTRKMIFMK